MKNLKKSLALVLAIALVFSLVVFANAEFTDAEDINPKFADAVGVMNGLGIIKGYDTGAFGPQDTLTRDQGAKIITMIKMGKASSTLPTNQVFNDVPADNWAAPYVAYAASKNIINGYGDGNFGPGDKLSGYAFGKMLFVALGYGQNNEFTGANWKIAVAEVASETGLFAGLEDYLSDDPLPREVAAQLAFNALGTPMVQYLKADDVYEEITTGTPPEAKTLAASVQDLDMTPVPGATDADGRPSKTYTNLTGTKVIYTTTAEPIKVIVDGSFDTSKAPYDKWDFSKLGTNGIWNRDDNCSAGSFEGEIGDTVEFFGYADKDGTVYITNIVGTEYTFYTVGKTDATKKEITIYEDADLMYPTVIKQADYPKSYETLAAFAEGDGIAVVENWGSGAEYLISAEKCEEVTGAKVTAVASTGDYYKIDGTKYDLGDEYYGPSFAAGDSVEGGKFYKNPNGYVIGYVGPTAAAPVAQTDFVYVVAYQANAKVDAGGTELNPTPGKPAAAKAEVIFTDGTHKVIDLAITKEGKFSEPDSDPSHLGEVNMNAVADVSETPIGTWFAYSEADGAYTLEELDSDYAAVAGSDVALVKGTPFNAGGVYTTSSTKIVRVDTKYKALEETGLIATHYLTSTSPDVYTDALVATNDSVLLTKAGASAKTIDAIYAVNQPEIKSGTTTEVDYAYAAAQGDDVEGGTEWTFYINGESKTYVIKTGETVAKGGVYELTKAGEVYTVKAVAKDKENKAIEVLDTTFVVVDGTTFNIGANTKVFDVKTGNGAAGTLAVGQKVDVINGGTAAAVIYIVG